MYVISLDCTSGNSWLKNNPGSFKTSSRLCFTLLEKNYIYFLVVVYVAAIKRLLMNYMVPSSVMTVLEFHSEAGGIQ